MNRPLALQSHARPPDSADGSRLHGDSGGGDPLRFGRPAPGPPRPPPATPPKTMEKRQWKEDRRH